MNKAIDCDGTVIKGEKYPNVLVDELLLRAMGHGTDTCMLALLQALTGLRTSEACSVRVNDPCGSVIQLFKSRHNYVGEGKNV